MKNIPNIGELNINDSILLESLVLLDSVEMKLKYIDDYELHQSSFKTLVFKDCSEIRFTINPCYDSPNSLLDAQEISCEQGRHIKINTNTTCGIIEIKCASVLLKDSLRNE